MFNILNYDAMDSFGFATMNCPCKCNTIINWLTYGKLPEDIVVSEAAIKVPYVVSASAKNRYLSSVTIVK